MAIFKSVVASKSRGKAGSTRFSRYRGAGVLAEQPISVANPKTSLQEQQRTLMRGASQLLKGYAQLFQSNSESLRATAKSHRGSLLTARSLFAKRIMQAASGSGLGTLPAAGEAFGAIATFLNENEFVLNPGVAKKIVPDVTLEVTSVTLALHSATVMLALHNFSTEELKIPRVDVFAPACLSYDLDRGISKSLKGTEFGIIVEPNTTANVEVVINYSRFDNAPSEIGWYIAEAEIPGKGLVQSNYGVIPADFGEPFEP